MILELKEKLESRLNNLRESFEQRKKRCIDKNNSFSHDAEITHKDGDSDSEYMVDDYFSDSETKPNGVVDEEEGEEFSNGRKKVEEELSITKIIYCSRTHSQLTQFVDEIQKTIYKDKVKVVPLASRKSLCVNDKVSKLSNDSYINDKCLDMQKNKTDKAYVKSRVRLA